MFVIMHLYYRRYEVPVAHSGSLCCSAPLKKAGQSPMICFPYLRAKGCYYTNLNWAIETVQMAETFKVVRISSPRLDEFLDRFQVIPQPQNSRILGASKS